MLAATVMLNVAPSTTILDPGVTLGTSLRPQFGYEDTARRRREGEEMRDR